MSNSFNGLINLTRLWEFSKNHPEKVIELKNGDKAIRFNLNEKKSPDQYGNTHYMEVDTYKMTLAEGENKYIGDNIKPSKFNELYNGNAANAAIPPAAPAASPAPVAPPPSGEPKENDLPF